MEGYWIPPKTCNSGRLHNLMVCVCVCVLACVRTCACVNVRAYLCMRTCLCFFESVCLCDFLSVLSVSVYLSACLSICLSVSVCLSVCLCACTFTEMEWLHFVEHTSCASTLTHPPLPVLSCPPPLHTHRYRGIQRRDPTRFILCIPGCLANGNFFSDWILMKVFWIVLNCTGI